MSFSLNAFAASALVPLILPKVTRSLKELILKEVKIFDQWTDSTSNKIDDKLGDFLLKLVTGDSEMLAEIKPFVQPVLGMLWEHALTTPEDWDNWLIQCIAESVGLESLLQAA